jgi:hypothetical protein
MSSRGWFVLAVLGVTLAGCAPPPAPEQLAPQKLTSPLPPIEVVRRATAKLIDLGFDIAISDATGGVVQSKRAHASMEHVTCRWPKGSAVERFGVATLTVSVSAVKQGEGSAVTITSRVNAEYPGLAPMFLAKTSPTEDCASIGVAERAVASAITGG